MMIFLIHSKRRQAMRRFSKNAKWMIQGPTEPPNADRIRNMYNNASTFINAMLPRTARTIITDRDCESHGCLIFMDSETIINRQATRTENRSSTIIAPVDCTGKGGAFAIREMTQENEHFIQ
jgi:hypothetical protein